MSTLPNSPSMAAAALMTQVQAQGVYHFISAGGQFLDDKDQNTAEWRAWKKEFAASLTKRIEEWAK
jgi:hypothetical protein